MEKDTVRATRRTFALIEALATGGALGVTELSMAADLNKSTVFRQLNTLAAMGYVKKDAVTSKYRLTFKLLELAEQLSRQADVGDMAHPYLEWLAEQTGETVHLVQKEGTHIVYIDKVEPTVNSVRMVSRVGMRQPMYCTAVGKALLAERSSREIHAMWEDSAVRPLTPHTLVNFEEFIQEIETIRRLGYAVDNEENELGVRCVAVALHNYEGKAQNALSVSAPAPRMTEDRLERVISLLLQAKQDFRNEWR